MNMKIFDNNDNDDNEEISYFKLYIGSSTINFGPKSTINLGSKLKKTYI